MDHAYLGYSFFGHTSCPIRSRIRPRMSKISIRFPLLRDEDIFDDREVRAIWDEEKAKWWFSVLDMVAVLTDQDDYDKTRNHWKYLKAKLKRENSEVVSATTQLERIAHDSSKNLLTDQIKSREMNGIDHSYYHEEE